MAEAGISVPAQETALPIEPEEVLAEGGRETPVSGDVPFATDAGGINLAALPSSGLLTDAGGIEVSPDMPGEASPASRFGPGNFVSDVLGPNDPLNKQLAEQYRKKFEAESYAGREATSRLEQDRRRMDDAFQRSSAMRDDPALKPWNADQERADRIRGPMEQFGSIGSIFAMAASMFTKAPMTSALNAGAAAMRSIQEHDEKGYEIAYTAWKANSDLALKRFDMERNLFHDANQMATTDLATWSAKRMAIAAQFEDQKAITFLENGMYKEVLDLDAKKVQMAEELRKHQEGMFEFNRSRQLWADGKKTFKEQWMQEHPEAKLDAEGNPDSPEFRRADFVNSAQLLHELKSGARSWQQEALRNFELTNPNATPDERTKFMQSLRGGRQGIDPNSKQALDVATRRAIAEDVDRELPDATPGEKAQEIEKRLARAKRAGVDPNSSQALNVAKFQSVLADVKKEHPDWSEGQQNEEVERRLAKARSSQQQSRATQTFDSVKSDVRKEHPDWSEGKVDIEANRRVAQSKAATSGNKQVELQQRINKFTHSIDTIDKVVHTLETHRGAAGIAGKVMRVEERLGNILGSKSTAYVQMMRDVELLRGWAKELLFSKNERLKAEGQRINDIIAGTSAGDTGPNTLRALRDAKKLMTQIRGEEEKMLRGNLEGVTETPKNTGPNWYNDLPDATVQQ